MKQFFLITLIALFSSLFANDVQIVSKYDQTTSFSADFTQFFTSKISKKVSGKEAGHLFYLAPTFIRFDYMTGKKLSRQTFVNETDITIVNHDKKSAMMQSKKGDLSQYLIFLKGTAEIKKTFLVSESDPQKAASTGIKIEKNQKIFKLKPLQNIQGVTYIFLIIEKEEVKSVVIIDELSNINQIIFSSVKINEPTNKNIFTPNIPKNYSISKF